LFWANKGFVLVIEFQVEGLLHEHGLLWVKNVVQFGVLKNENIECFIDIYLTINQTI
jgi:hypothetical protein